VPKALYFFYGVFDDSCVGSPNALAPLTHSRMTGFQVGSGRGSHVGFDARKWASILVPPLLHWWQKSEQFKQVPGDGSVAWRVHPGLTADLVRGVLQAARFGRGSESDRIAVRASGSPFRDTWRR
jgi:hypothetical protein